MCRYTKMNTVCFTGHRPQKLGGFDESNPMARRVRDWLEQEIGTAYHLGYRTFVSGAALGVDTWAAEMVIEMMAEDEEVRLILAVPGIWQPATWYDPSIRRWCQLVRHASQAYVAGYDPAMRLEPEDLVTQAKEYRFAGKHGMPPLGMAEVRQAMMQRNRFMVDRSGYVIAVYDGSTGGTGNCVGYALNQGKQVVQIHPARGIIEQAQEVKV